MKKSLSWQVLLGVAAVAFILGKLLGGVIGDCLNLLFIITLLLGIVNIFQKKPKDK